ncbi:Hypothetical predicted protein [Prunus dulcis]|uniref:Uncharacterized protein n=1 Tax=Prunus dulcis TaxID=3755 RepID=A0A5E4EAD0_PRUDU|nr:Hypothetical predicted protein [Prunus dulcis]
MAVRRRLNSIGDSEISLLNGGHGRPTWTNDSKMEVSGEASIRTVVVVALGVRITRDLREICMKSSKASKKFVHTNRRRRPWCSRSARHLHEISQKLVIGLDFRDLGWLPLPAKIFSPYVKIENAKRSLPRRHGFV